jgi:hypothetical protein
VRARRQRVSDGLVGNRALKEIAMSIQEDTLGLEVTGGVARRRSHKP